MMDSPTIINILHARKTHGLYSSVITGKRGLGKSSYALRTLFLVFRKLGNSVDDSWQMALDRCLYTIPEVVHFLEKSSDLKHKDLFIWDDAGVYAGGVRWLTHYKEMALIESLTDVIRNMVYGVLLTVPDIRTLSRRLRSYDDYLVKIYLPFKKKKSEIINPNIRHARVYQKSLTPAGQYRIYKKYQDEFDIMLPDWVFEKYEAKRNVYGKQDIKQLKKLSGIE